MKVSWDTDADAGASEAAHRLWGNDALPGQLAQILPRPQDFEAGMSLVPPDAVAETIVCGDDPKAHLDRAHEYLDAGVDELYVHQIGPAHRRVLRGLVDADPSRAALMARAAGATPGRAVGA